MEKFHETLDKNTKASALALKELLGEIELEPVPGECIVENGQLIERKPYYMAYTDIQTLALLDETKGSNWLQWRREWDSNPRNAFTFTRFPSELLKPLGHLSAKKPLKTIRSLLLKTSFIDSPLLYLPRKAIVFTERRFL